MFALLVGAFAPLVRNWLVLAAGGMLYGVGSYVVNFQILGVLIAAYTRAGPGNAALESRAETASASPAPQVPGRGSHYHCQVQCGSCPPSGTASSPT